MTGHNKKSTQLEIKGVHEAHKNWKSAPICWLGEVVQQPIVHKNNNIVNIT